jgi:hypothetical protein
MFLGYTKDHINAVYRFLNINTNMVNQSYDVIWLNQSYGDYKNLSMTEIMLEENDNSDDEPITNIIQGSVLPTGMDPTNGEAVIIDLWKDPDDANPEAP